MKKAVLGSGFLALEYAGYGYEKIGRDKLEITHKLLQNRSSYSILDKILGDYDVIVNCIGISNTRYCEDRANWEEVHCINGILPGYLSKWCERRDKQFIHISTGCLYAESHRPCTEDDFIEAHCNYAVSKFVGEMGCNPERDIILRPRLLFSHRVINGNNLICKLQQFTAFVDEFNSITHTYDIVGASEALLKSQAQGIYNIANDGVFTIYEIARMIKKRFLAIGQDPKIDKMTAQDLRSSQNLYLVNNVMDLTKIKQFYKPVKVEDAIHSAVDRMSGMELAFWER